MSLPHITVCVCTYRRPELLRATLAGVAAQGTGVRFVFSIVVIDNDGDASARQLVSECATQFPVGIEYAVEPRRNIALARNAAIERASGDFIALIDDDERPQPGWLLSLYETCEVRCVDGVLGPVVPAYECDPPEWVKRAGFYKRPRHPTGFVMGWPECRTGNALFRRSMLDTGAPAFDPQFATGGEDVDFFRRMVAKGRVFVWCDEAVVQEHVPAHRWSRRFLMKRALLRGQTTLKHQDRPFRSILKSLAAVLVYLTMLPFLLMAGQHWFIKYLVRLCDHAGKLLCAVGIRVCQQREM